IAMGPGGCPLDLASKASVTIDGQKLAVAGPMSDRPWNAHLRTSGTQWTAVESAEFAGLHKQHGLQGPIDDAFLDSFVFVSPTGAPMAAGGAVWVVAQEKSDRGHFAPH